MGDIYQIPNDNGVDYRLKKFVEYQHEAPGINHRYTGDWIKKYNYEKNRAVNLCWIQAVTYNEITAILIDYMIHSLGLSYREIWEKYKGLLNFGSAQKYIKNLDQFVSIMENWDRQTLKRPFSWLYLLCNGNDIDNYKKVEKCVRSWKNVGRFTADKFLEAVCYIRDFFGIKAKETVLIDWKNGSNLTAGTYNIFYEDEKAIEYEKNHSVKPEDAVFLTNCLSIIQDEIKKTYPEENPNIENFVGKICSFRNLFKGRRYAGFHHDRQLGVIKQYEKSFPEYKELWEKCYELRRETFPEQFLGEIHGWNGIRKERTKIWLTMGKTGVEKL